MPYSLYNQTTGEEIFVSKEDYEKVKNKDKLTPIQQKAFYIDLDVWDYMEPKINKNKPVIKEIQTKTEKAERAKLQEEVKEKVLKLRRKTNVKNRKQSNK